MARLQLTEIIPTILLLISSFGLVGISAQLALRKNISEHIQHAAIAVLICALLTPILMIAKLLKPTVRKSIIILAVLTFLWTGSTVITVASAKYAEKKTKLLWVVVIMFVSSQLLSCSALWFNVSILLRQGRAKKDEHHLQENGSSIQLNGNLKEGASLASIYSAK
ncbi:hypothetical protein GLAREA_01185 [Glarea lozoyensis ATCC 20868]|uniref:Uncharacterized protein n=1 Tax=Glarea lozoyensis (strain ATCC 20868 / MF5171) TaxID=1116229 RepID=S3DF66_GLAL2|nr:uncharacterized protein GLAREA_01185 [Glarea lozoyensis ATCC 20868]EPE25273.1 hypothetical protein GLAREA_01185 [Glarea lozoyensis ATCC 20868]